MNPSTQTFPPHGWQYPEITRLTGRYVQVEPINPARHAADLYALSHHPPQSRSLFTYLSFGPYETEADMRTWLQTLPASRDPRYYAVFSLQHQRWVGMISLLNISTVHGRVELGNIWYSPLAQKTKVNTEVTFLFLRELFHTFQYRRVEWKCDNNNTASRQAALRMGFQQEGIFRQHMVIKGKNRDTAWFSIIDSDFPRLERNFTAYLSGQVPSLAQQNAL